MVKKVIGRSAFVAYLVAMVVVVAGPWGGQLNDLTVWLYVQFRYVLPLAPGWAKPEHYGLLLNVVLFVPLGAGLVWLTRWAWWQVTLAAAAASTVVELIQVLLPREATAYDVITNTLGAAIGAYAFTVWQRALSPRAR